MKAQVISVFGDPSVFTLSELPVPEIRTGHVLIEVKATSVNPIDIKIRAGAVPAISPSFPAVLHSDVAGIVVEVGEGVSEFNIGDEVFGCAGGFRGLGGALAEYMLADANLLALKPHNLTMEDAAAIPLVGITAWEALGNVSLQERDILIHGATGGVGHLAIQLAKIKGANVFATASTSEKRALAKQLGADVVIDYRKVSVPDYVQAYTDGKGFDVVFDTVGGENLDRSFQAAKTHGTVLGIAARSTHDLSPMHSKGLSLHITFMILKLLTEDKRKDHGRILKQLAKLVEENKVIPLIDPHRFTFDEISEAHSYVESKHNLGKVVLQNNWS